MNNFVFPKDWENFGFFSFFFDEIIFLEGGGEGGFAKITKLKE